MREKNRELKMTDREAVLAIAKPVEIESFFPMESLPTDAAVALLMHRRFTERDLIFLRDYFPLFIRSIPVPVPVSLYVKYCSKIQPRNRKNWCFYSRLVIRMETSRFLEKHFGESAREIKAVSRNGSQIGSVLNDIFPIDDYKVLFHLTGCFGPNNTYPWYCLVSREHMDCSKAELLQEYSISDLMTAKRRRGLSGK